MTYRDLPEQFYSEVQPYRFLNPEIIWFNSALAQNLNLPPDFAESALGMDILTGQTSLTGQVPISMAYSGHQFGHYAPTLGDGRAKLVGEVTGQDDQTYDIHLKGAGPTLYSRRGDGKATLGAAIREALLSEAMHALGIPTTRALAIIKTGETIQRMSPEPEPGAILARTAKAHIRVGTFQFAAANLGEAGVQSLWDWTQNRLYPDRTNPADMFRDICERQAKLIAQWMGFGFIHGVMNTDNMMLSGETVDYGPCAFIDTFHPAKVFSSIDYYGRYAWNKQASIGQWNLVRLAEALIPLISQEDAQDGIRHYSETFNTAFNQIFCKKLGLSQSLEEEEPSFLENTFSMMTETQSDFTQFFTAISRHAQAESKTLDKLPIEWVNDWHRLRDTSNNAIEAMVQHNPVRIARNHQVAHAIRAADTGQITPFLDLLYALSDPFTEPEVLSKYVAPPLESEVVHQTFCGT